MTPITFHMPKQLEAVDPMVLTLKRHVEGVLADEALFRFDICISETLTNLVLHAQTDVADAAIDVILDCDAARVVAEIYDPTGAKAFDIRQQGCDLAQVDPMAEGGRGLGLIRDCADALDYGPVNDRNRLKLTFEARS